MGAFITGTAYFALGIPISYLCAFKREQGIRGLWWGPTVAVAYNTLCYNIIIYCINWQKLIQGVYDRD